MIDLDNFCALALHLGFTSDTQAVSDVLHKSYGDNGIAIRIDLVRDQPIKHLNAKSNTSPRK